MDRSEPFESNPFKLLCLIFPFLSQTNVLASAQRRKMKGYGDFKRIAAVIIPDDTTYKERCDKQTEKTVSENILNEMKGERRFNSVKCFH